VILASPGEPIDVHQLFPMLSSSAPPVSVNAAGALEQQLAADSGTLYDEVQRRRLTLDELEHALIQEAVARANGNLAAAARALGLTRPQLSYRVQRLRCAAAPA
jgi:transcriptional regulator with GAF, ATPase, and Fis domain